MRATWVLLAFTALLGAVRCDLVDDVQKTIEDFRALMPTGDAALDIPQLEPLSISRIPLSIKVTPFNANIVAKNIVASGASGFQITKISQRDDGKLALSLEIPTIEVTGEYTIDGKVKVGFISVKLSGSGPLSLSAGGIKGDGVADVQEDSNGALHVNDLQITSWSYKKMKVQLDGLFGGGVMGKTVNALINKIIPPFIKSNKQKINELIQAKAKSFINKYLDGISGNKALREYVTEVMSEDWIISTETQGMLNQLAKTVLAAQVADKSSDSPTTLEEQTAHILESFKAMMKDGRPDFNIPVLDPAVVNKLAIDVKHALFNAKIIATDANVQGVSDFSVTKISQIDDTNKVTVEVEIPAVKIESQFEMHGKVSIPFAPAINDFGPLQLNITDLQLAATVEVLSNPDGSYNIGTVVMDSWSFSTIKIQLDNLLGGGPLGKAANNLFNKIFPTLVENDRPKINRRLENVVKNLFNAYLDGIAGKTSDDLSAKLEEISELFRSAMKTGRADINIPVMDPAVVEVVSVEVDKWPIVADISLSKITVSGASDFKLTKVSQIVGTNKVAVDIEVPSIVATCTYDVESTVHAAFLKFNLNRQGPLQLNIQGLTATTIAELSVESDEQLGLINFEVESLSYSSIEVQVDDWINGSFFKRLFNKLVNKLVPSVLIRPHETEVSEWASRAGQRIIGHFIDAVAGRVVLPNLDVRAESLIEQFKGLMKTGSKNYNMPVYDPASVNDINLEVPLPLTAKAALEVSDINVLGSSDFTISKITQSANTNNLDIDIVVPALATNCKFLATTTVLNLKDSGSATANVDNLTISVTASLSSDINGFLVLRKLEIRSWSMGGIKVAFENLDKLGTLGKALSKVINKVLPKIIEAKRASLSEWAEEAARNVIDKFLAGVASQATLPQAIRAGYFTPESIQKELANFASLAA